jgi:hypothetical protein
VQPASLEVRDQEQPVSLEVRDQVQPVSLEVGTRFGGVGPGAAS